jgi:hypothetical protein
MQSILESHLISRTFSNFSTYWASNTHTLIITIHMHLSIFGTHVIEPNSELHKFSVVFATTCAPLLLVLQIGKCCELNCEMIMFFLERSEKL